MITKTHVSALILTAGLASHGFSALTPIQSANFSAISDGTYTNLDGNRIIASGSESLSTFAKFDPSLGTLTRVLFTAEIRMTFDIRVETDDLVDSSQLFSLSLGEAALTVLQASLGYNPTGSPFNYALAFDNGGFSSVGGEDLNPSDYTSSFGLFYDDSTSGEFGGFAFGNSDVTSGVLDATSSFFVADDFIGTGFVNGLNIGPFIQLEMTDLRLENINSAFAEVSVGLDAGTATLQYEFTPVPEPSVYALVFGFAGVVCVFARRRK